MVPVIFYLVGNNLLILLEPFLHVQILHGDVSQGSILGPLLFLIYVNDMYVVVGNTLLYANDSAILVADKDTSTSNRFSDRK